MTTYTHVSAAEDYGTWSYYVDWQLNTTNSGADITDTLFKVPVFISLTPSSFSDFSNTSSFGADIRFADPSGKHLAYQIERWEDGVGDQDTAAIWVLIDTLIGNFSGQNIRMYYGQSGTFDSSAGGAVFDSGSGHTAVWHLDEWMTGTGFDSIYADAANGQWGKDYMSSTLRPYMVGWGQEFNGTSDYILVPPSAVLNDLDTLSLSGWFRLDSYGGAGQGRMLDKINSFGLYADQTDSALVFEARRWGTTDGRWRTPLYSFQLFQWYHVAVVYEYVSVANDPQIYINGIAQSVTELSAPSGTVVAETDTLFLGNNSDGNRKYHGWMDEVRIEHAVRAPSWYKLAYENQRSGQTFVAQPISFSPILHAYAAADSSIALDWDITGLDTNIHDSVGIWYRTDYMPDSTGGIGTYLVATYGLVDSVDTVYNLDPDSMYYFGLFFKDTGDVWSDTGMAAFDFSTTGGGASAVYLSALSFADSIVMLAWDVTTVDTTHYDSVGIWYRFGMYANSVTDSSAFLVGTYGMVDTLDTLVNLEPDSLYYFSLFLQDTAGVWDSFSSGTDSAQATGGVQLYLRNTVNKSITQPGDTLIYTIYYDNDGLNITTDTVTIQQLLPQYVVYDSGSVSAVYHTSEFNTQIRYSTIANISVLNKDSLWAATYPDSVGGIKWTFNQPVGAHDFDDTQGISDDSGDVDAGFVRFRVLVK